MRKNLPTENFLKIAVVDTIETRLSEPKNLQECVNKIRTYIHDVQIAFGILQAFGPSQQNVHVNPVKVCAVLRAFADHVRTVDSYLATKIVMMGQPSENAPTQQLVQYAVQLLGIMAEPGPTTKDKPQANAAGASDTRERRAGNSKKGKDDPKPPNKPVTCNYFSMDKGCRRGAECPHFHPRLTKEDGRCFNCGGKGHTTHECDKPPKKPKRDGKNTGGSKGKSTGNAADKGKGAPSTGKGTASAGKSGGKAGKAKAKAKGKPKPKASAASAEVEVEEPQ
eukprot:6339738-Amphidinium_carterae.1